MAPAVASTGTAAAAMTFARVPASAFFAFFAFFGFAVAFAANRLGAFLFDIAGNARSSVCPAPAISHECFCNRACLSRHRRTDCAMGQVQ